MGRKVLPLNTTINDLKPGELFAYKMEWDESSDPRIYMRLNMSPENDDTCKVTPIDGKIAGCIYDGKRSEAVYRVKLIDNSYQVT